MSIRNPRLSDHVHGLHKDVTDSGSGGKPEYSQKENLSAAQPYFPPPLIKPLSEILWDSQDARIIRSEAMSTNFVQGIFHGCLNPTVFGGYMVQDSVYCYRAKDSIDTALCRATPGALKTYLQKESGSYERYYQDLFSKWHIEDSTGIKLNDACESYAKYEHEIAEKEDNIYMIVAMLPCMKLWPWLGQQLQSGCHGVYTEWFNNNFDPTYEGYKVLDNFIDKAYFCGCIDVEKALTVFLTCLKGEYSFFNSVQPKK